MNLTCPHCGKGLSISHDELVVCRGVVICPQCLTEFVADGVELPEPEAVAQVDPKPAVLEVQSHGGERFCYGCGRELPHHEGLRYCPFCGVPLLANEQSQPAREPVVATVATQPRTAVSAKASGSKSSSKLSSSSSSNTNAYRYVPNVYSKELPPEPPSLRFKILAYSIIMVLLAILGFIIYKGSQL